MAWLRMPTINKTDRQRAYLGMAEEPAIKKTDRHRAYLGMAVDADHR